jgi:hypothetical protein
MKARIQRIEINNFKAFRQFHLNLDGRHLLLYGPNGSGKSSLYWALYTFLQSGRKSSISKYFDPADKERLLNIYEDERANPGSISITFRGQKSKIDTTYTITLSEHSTKGKPDITKAELASDFVTYRFFFGFSDFKNSQDFDLWPLFLQEILPFCRSTSGTNPLEAWQDIESEEANPEAYKGRAGAQAYDSFRRATVKFANILDPIVDSISRRAQEFYDEFFSVDDPGKVELQLIVKQRPKFEGSDRASAKFTHPVIEFGIRVDGKQILRPQSFLNEAKMTQLALSIRFAASLVNLHESDIKLLVLDDLLVSLDMSNRMRVVEILFSKDFVPYQKFILTHDLGLFQELRRHIGSRHSDWQYVTLRGNAQQGPFVNVAKSDLEVAQDYLSNDQLAECGNRLRKCVEEVLEQFLIIARDKTLHGDLISRGEFASLESKINEAKGLLCQQALNDFAAVLQSDFTADEFAAILSEEGIDPTKIVATDSKKKGKIIARLMAARKQLQDTTLHLLTDQARKQLNAAKLLDEIKKIKNRILNPASHAGVTPLYTKEAEDAIKVVDQLRVTLDAVLPTL